MNHETDEKTLQEEDILQQEIPQRKETQSTNEEVGDSLTQNTNEEVGDSLTQRTSEEFGGSFNNFS